METCTVIIETPKNSAVKFSFNKELNLFQLKKILPAGLLFPFDFGFIPDTIGEDGDPLDVIVIAEFTGFAGCVIDCSIVGVIEVEQQKNGKIIRNDRFIGIPILSVQYGNIKEVKELPKKMVVELQQFFINYTSAAGIKIHILKTSGSRTAYSLIRKQRVTKD